jgi:hypothetical protein
MTHPHIEDPEQSEIIDGVDVDHIDERPDELEHVGIQETPDGLEALPANESDTRPPGYVEIDVDLMEWDDVCDYVMENTDYDRRIDFSQAPAWTPDGPTASGRPPGLW